MKRHVTTAGLLALIGSVGGGLTYSVDWAIKTQEKLGLATAERDSLQRADSLLFAYAKAARRDIRQLQRALGVRSGAAAMVGPPAPPAREGVVQAIWHLFWRRR